MRPAVRKLGPMCVQMRGAGGELEVAPMPAFTVGGPVMKRTPPPPRPPPPVDLPTAAPAPGALPSTQLQQEQPLAAPTAPPAADAMAPAAVRKAEEQREANDALPAAEPQPESAARGPAESGAQPGPAAVVSGGAQQDARQASATETSAAVEAVTPTAPAACASGASAETADGELSGLDGGAEVAATAGQPLQPPSLEAGQGVKSPTGLARQSARVAPSAMTVGACVPSDAAQAPADGIAIAPQLGAATAPVAYLATAAATEAAALTSGVGKPRRPDSGIAAGITEGAFHATAVGPSVPALVPTVAATAADVPPQPMASAGALRAAQPLMVSPPQAPSGWEGGGSSSEMAVAAQRAAFEAALGMTLGPDFSTLTQSQPTGVMVPLRGPAVRAPAAVPMRPQQQVQPSPQVPAQQQGAADAVRAVPSDPVAMFLNDGPDR